MVDRLRDLALASERRLGDVGVEPDVEPREGRVDPAEDPLGGSSTHRGQPLFIRERRPPGFRRRELAAQLIDILAVVAVLGDLGRTSQVAQVARVHRGSEAVHLTAGVVVVVLALHGPSGGIEQTRDRVAKHGVPRVPDVQGPGRVRAHELHLDAPFDPRCRPVRGSLGCDPAQDVVQPPFGEEDVDESRTGDLHLPDERRRWQRRDDRLRHREGRRRDARRHLERDVRGEVSVLLLSRFHHLGFGQLAVQPQLGCRSLETRPEPSPELVLDHAPAPSMEPRTVSIKACASKGLVM